MNVDEPAENERRIVSSIDAGEPVDLSGADVVHRTLRAEWLSELLTTAPPSTGGRVRPVRIRGARITGPLDLEACTLTRPLLLEECHFDDVVTLNDATALTVRLPGCRLPGLSARSLHTAGDLELNDGFTAEGTVDLLGADIGGKLSLRRAHIANPGGWALNADRLVVAHGLFCSGGFTAEGELRLLGAHIGGRIDLQRAHIANPGGTALQGSWLTVGQHMLCEGLHVEGRINLAGARIPHLNMSEATLRNPGGTALDGYGVIVEHDILCSDGFTAEGELNLCRAQIDGQLYLDGAQLTNPGGRALYADALTTKQSLFCRDGFAAEGEVRVIGARIGGVCNLTGARLRNPGGRALYAVRIQIEGDLLCRNGFTAEGRVQLGGASVGGQLDLQGARLLNPGHQALDLEAARASELILMPAAPPDGLVNLTNAQVGIFHDEQATWPAVIRLEGFTYDSLVDDAVDARERLRWLTRNRSGYKPQLYDQLAAAYRRAGQEEAARQVAIAKQRHRRQVLGLGGKLANWLLYVTVGYGYRTRLAAAWLIGLLGVGTCVFAYAHPSAMTRSNPNGPTFNAFAYTLDVLLPVIDLGQQKAWHPQGAAMYCSWLLIAGGWLLATAIVAGLTGIIKRN
ncbi:hypothetical protein [Actinomadura algeriensis]|uniref:Membrane-associated oxidoreductase n=1 Tax=Actinomadura algeriensis TaxID=1679523 RepID=A0ABR9JSF2_9ACTN|nr:hypothetical protein [Actinomadura algeriensis]MBE1533496.1 hypothetical protein [Actinomadura algeriensis]